jgi:hypothetical protein
MRICPNHSPFYTVIFHLTALGRLSHTTCSLSKYTVIFHFTALGRLSHTTCSLSMYTVYIYSISPVDNTTGRVTIHGQLEAGHGREEGVCLTTWSAWRCITNGAASCFQAVARLECEGFGSSTDVRKAGAGTARCAFSDRNLHSRMPMESHACSLEANMRLTNCIPLGSPLLLPVGTVNSITTLQARMHTRVHLFRKGVHVRREDT